MQLRWDKLDFRTLRELGRVQRKLDRLGWRKLGKVPWVLLVTLLPERVLCNPPWKVIWREPRRVPQVPRGRAKLVSKRPPIAHVRRPPQRNKVLWPLALLVWEPHNKVLARSEAQQGLSTRLPQRPL